MVLMAPSNEAELCHAVATAISIDDRPSCLRFPRGTGIGVDMAAAGVNPATFKGKPWEIGKGVVRRSGRDVAFVCYGTLVNSALEAAEMLQQQAGVSATVVDMRFCKPLDTELLMSLAKEHEAIVTVEEGAIGGFAAHVMQFLALDGALDSGKLKIRPMTLPDHYIEHGTQADQLAEAGLSSSHMAATALSVLGRKDAVASVRAAAGTRMV